MPSVYPRPHITWKRDNTFVPESKTEEIGYLGPFHINSTINITESNSSYECAIENSLLNQTWIGRWTLAGRLLRTFCVQVLCQRLGGTGD
jgi:hypothetical protein